MTDKRFTITFSGEHEATTLELFPDGEKPWMTGLFGAGGPSLSEFLDDWNYGETLCITVTDNETGEAWTKPARPLAGWDQLYAPQDVENLTKQLAAAERTNLRLRERVRALELEVKYSKADWPRWSR